MGEAQRIPRGDHGSGWGVQSDRIRAIEFLSVEEKRADDDPVRFRENAVDEAALRTNGTISRIFQDIPYRYTIRG